MHQIKTTTAGATLKTGLVPIPRYSHYVKQNLQKGYAIELLGFGKLDIKFIKTTTPDEKKATSALVKGMMPNFVPSFKIVNGKRIYDIIPCLL